MAVIDDQCQALIANYLQANGYADTLKAFVAENTKGKPADQQQRIADTRNALPVELQQLVEHYLRQGDLYYSLQNLAVSGTSPRSAFDWYSELDLPLPNRVSKTIQDAHLSGVLSVTCCDLPRRSFSTQSACYRSADLPCIVTTAVDRRIVYTNTASWEQEDAYGPLESVALVAKNNPKYPWLMAAGHMDGSISIFNLLSRSSEIIKMHSKYVVRLAWSDDGRWLCSAGYDRLLCVHEAVVTKLQPAEHLDDQDQYASIPEISFACRWKKTLPTNPEACVFLPDSSHLLYTRRDDNHLIYVRMPHKQLDDMTSSDFELQTYNLNQNLDSHISFCVLSLAIHPSKQAISLQTDTAISRIILLPFYSSKILRETLYTNAEQSAFSNPRHSWLSCGTGVAVSSDDGIVRIVDLNGKVKASYGAHGVAAAHEDDNLRISSETLRARFQADKGSSVVRDLCVLPDNSIVSVGLDRTIRIAKVEQTRINAF